jgi:hypothetical protein
MAVTFMVLKENGNVVLRQAVRVAKRSLVFSESVDGGKEVAKDKCYYYTDERETDFRNLKRISLRLKHLKKEVEGLRNVAKRIQKLEAEKEILLGKFTKVTIKSTRF